MQKDHLIRAVVHTTAKSKFLFAVIKKEIEESSNRGSEHATRDTLDRLE
jgi:hypothetical protein